MKVLEYMGDRDTNANSKSISSSQSIQPSKTSLEFDLRFKMTKEHNNTVLPPTPTSSSTDSECSKGSASLDKELKKDTKPQDEIIRRKLSKRAYHLPGNSCCQDLGMYMRNNHLVFGMCCYHRLHPVRLKHRLVILLGSLSFGLCATNAVFLYYLWGGDANHDDSAFTLSLGGEVVETVASTTLTVDISHGMALLWTVGAASHSLFDLILWHMVTCGNMKHKYCRAAGWSMAVAIVMVVVAFTTFVVVVRAYESVEEEEDDGINIETFGNEADFQYLYGYVVELIISLFVFTPIAQIILFSGILGCCSLPVLGGRSYEMRKSKRRDDEGKKENSTGAEKV